MPTLPPDGPEAPSNLPVRLLRVDDDTRFIVRFLEEKLQGMLTHWNGKRSERCWPEKCDRCAKHHRQYFKGYAAAELWRPINRDWYPVVFEATEALEQVMAPHNLKGEVWEVWRLKKEGTKPMPVEGKYIETHSHDTLPEEPHDIKPILLSVYGPGPLYLGKKNPLGAKIYCNPSKAPAPPSEESPREKDAREKAAAAAALKEHGSLGERFRQRTAETQQTGKHDPILAPELRHLANGIGTKH